MTRIRLNQENCRSYETLDGYLLSHSILRENVGISEEVAIVQGVREKRGKMVGNYKGKTVTLHKDVWVGENVDPIAIEKCYFVFAPRYIRNLLSVKKGKSPGKTSYASRRKREKKG